MTQIRARILVGPDHRISGSVPDDVPPGEHEAVITVAPTPKRQPSAKPFNVDDLPSHDVPWDGSISLRREDMYGDDGR